MSSVVYCRTKKEKPTSLAEDFDFKNEFSNLVFEEVEISKEDLASEVGKKTLSQYQLVLLSPGLREVSIPWITNRSVQSYFAHYTDYLVIKEGRWWSETIMTEAFQRLLFSPLGVKNFKGPALFLGNSSYCIPLVDHLTKIGILDIVFLDINGVDHVMSEGLRVASQSIFGLELSVVDSSSFIQSNLEFSFCFVALETYDQEVLEDMSYFHFLSPRSTVVSLVESSNFLFEEIMSLEMLYIGFDKLKEIERELLKDLFFKVNSSIQTLV